jgi:CRP-like cAMP-binding protein
MRPDADTVGRAAIFEALGAADRDALCACFRGRAYAPGEVLFQEGEPASSLFLVGQGSFVASSRAAGSLREVGRFGRGQLVDETAIALRGRRLMTASAVGGALAYELDVDTLEVLRASAPAAARAVLTAAIRGVLRRLRQLEQRVERELERTGSA